MAATLPHVLLIEIVAPQLVIKYSINNSHQPDVNLTRTKVVSYIAIYLYKVIGGFLWFVLASLTCSTDSGIE